MSISDPRIQLASELRAAGLVEKADKLLTEIVHEKIGARPIGEIQADLDDTLGKLRTALGMRPKRKRAKNPKPTVQERLIVLLSEAGLHNVEAFRVSQG